MASNPPPSDITQCSAEELLAALGTLGGSGRDTLGASMIRELQQRDMSLNRIADDSGMARTTVKRWAGKDDSKQEKHDA